MLTLYWRARHYRLHRASKLCVRESEMTHADIPSGKRKINVLSVMLLSENKLRTVLLPAELYVYVRDVSDHQVLNRTEQNLDTIQSNSTWGQQCGIGHNIKYLWNDE